VLIKKKTQTNKKEQKNPTQNTKTLHKRESDCSECSRPVETGWTVCFPIMAATSCTEVLVPLLRGSLVYLLLLCTSSVLFFCLSMQFPPHSSRKSVKNKSSWLVVELGNAQSDSACRVLSPLPSGHCTCSRGQEAWLACVAASCYLYRVKLKLLYLV